MASIYDLKPAFQNVLRPVLNRLARLGVTPNQITVLALLLSLIGGVLVGLAPTHPTFLLLIPLILFLRMALNALDGMLAREYQLSSPLGEILNEVGDILSDTCLYLPFVVLAPNNMLAIFQISLFVILGIMCEFSGVLAKSMIQVRCYDGPMGKSDRAFVMGVFSLLLFFWPQFVLTYTQWLFIGFNALLMMSCMNRLKRILRKGDTHQ